MISTEVQRVMSETGMGVVQAHRHLSQRNSLIKAKLDNRFLSELKTIERQKCPNQQQKK